MQLCEISNELDERGKKWPPEPESGSTIKSGDDRSRDEGREEGMKEGVTR